MATGEIVASLLVLIPTVLVLGFGVGLTIRFAIQSRRGPPDPEVVDLIGQVVETTSALNYRGTIRARGETWTATARTRASPYRAAGARCCRGRHCVDRGPY